MADGLTKEQIEAFADAVLAHCRPDDDPVVVEFDPVSAILDLTSAGLEIRPIPAESGERWEAERWFADDETKRSPRYVAACFRDLPAGAKYLTEYLRVAYFNKASDRDRAVACVNAMAGIEDPEAAIRAAREALRNARRLHIARRDGHTIPGREPDRVFDSINAALALLGAPKP